MNDGEINCFNYFLCEITDYLYVRGNPFCLFDLLIPMSVAQNHTSSKLYVCAHRYDWIFICIISTYVLSSSSVDNWPNLKILLHQCICWTPKLLVERKKKCVIFKKRLFCEMDVSSLPVREVNVFTFQKRSSLTAKLPFLEISCLNIVKTLILRSECFEFAIMQGDLFLNLGKKRNTFWKKCYNLL